MKDRKNKLIQIRITESEKKEIESKANEHGFDSVSQFFLWLFRKFGRK